MSFVRISVAAFCLFATSPLPVSSATRPPASRVPAHSQPPPAVGWPQILRDAGHSSVSPDKLLSTSTAPTIGINWMSDMREPDLGSPVSTYNATLGKTVAYVGDERGDVMAFDESTGTTIWSTSVGYGDSLRSTPMVAPDGSVWAGTSYDPTLYKLDGTTGKVLCSLKVPLRMDASVMFATPPGGVPMVFTATNYSQRLNGREFAVRESDCTLMWSFDKWLTITGAWATPAFGIDASGKGRVFVGTADPDATMYSVDALTGKLLWDFSVLNPPAGAFDIGAAATVSAPGNNGFADGVLYFPTKYGIMYALDLTTGKPIWQFNFNKQAHVHDGGRSAAALYKTSLVYGMADGVEALDAKTGKLLWHYVDPAKQEVISSPAIVGPSGKEVVVFGDVAGLFTVLRLADGKRLYGYQTGNYITSSPAVINGHVLIGSTDSFLYDFTAGGGNSVSPATAISSPVTGSKVSNPAGALTVSGSASDPVDVTEVQVAIQMGGPTGPWYDATSGTWLKGAVNNFVGVDHPGQSQSTWSFKFPVPSSGSTYQVTANAVDLLGQVDRVGAQSSFAVLPDPQQPQLTLSAAVVAPTQTFTAYGSAFKPGEVVDFVLQNVTVGHSTATKTGFVPKLTIKVPSRAIFGPSALTATGETSHKTTSAPVDISNVWAQLGYDATHAAYEPHDSVLRDTLQATHGGYLSRSWLFATGAAVEAAPAVVAGAAYVANTAGALSAVDSVSGAPFWTYTIASKAAIHGSPAVGNGDVVFGADDGSLYRVAAATGAPIGSAALDGVPTAPAIAGGTIYVGTDNGTVYAIDDASGNPLWTRPLGAAIHQAPSVDAAAGVVVGDDAGNVTTLDPATGAVLRTTPTGGAAITAAPILAGGKVFAGAADGKVYSFDESSGKPGWKYAAGSPVASLAATSTDVYVGTAAGTLTKLEARRGQAVFSDGRFGSAVVGIGHTDDVSVAETMKGHVNALKDDQGGRIQYDYVTSAGLDTQPAIVDGAVFVGAEDGSLYTFTNHGQAPQDAFEHQFLLQLRENGSVPASWPAAFASRQASAERSFQPHGPRQFPLLLDRASATQSVDREAVNARNVSAKTVVVAWGPTAQRVASARVGQGTTVVTDIAPIPASVDDATVQGELARLFGAAGRNFTGNVRFVVVMDVAPKSVAPYCAYRSAFDLGGSLARTLQYAVVPVSGGETCGAVLQREAGAAREMQRAR